MEPLSPTPTITYAEFLAAVQPGYDYRNFFVVRFADRAVSVSTLAGDIERKNREPVR